MKMGDYRQADTLLRYRVKREVSLYLSCASHPRLIRTLWDCPPPTASQSLPPPWDDASSLRPVPFLIQFPPLALRHILQMDYSRHPPSLSSTYTFLQNLSLLHLASRTSSTPPLPITAQLSTSPQLHRITRPDGAQLTSCSLLH